MTDAVVTQAALEIAYAIDPDVRVTQAALEIAYQTQVGPTLKVQVAWNPTYTGPARWGQAYADVTERLEACSVYRHVGSASWAPDEATFILQNDDLRYTAAHVTSPLYGVLAIDPAPGAGQEVRVLGTWLGVDYPLFYGRLTERYTPLSPTPNRRTVQFKAASPAAQIAALASPPFSGTHSVVPYAPGNNMQVSGYQSVLDDLLALPAVAALIPANAWALDEDRFVIPLFEAPGSIGGTLQPLAAQSGGLYYVRPMLEAAAEDPPFQFVWQAMATTTSAPAARALTDVAPVPAAAVMELPQAFEQEGAIA